MLLVYTFFTYFKSILKHYMNFNLQLDIGTYRQLLLKELVILAQLKRVQAKCNQKSSSKIT